MFKGKIKILDSKAKISDNILEASGKELKLIIARKKPRIESIIKDIVRQSLMDSPEIHSLSIGKLKSDFGLIDDPTQNLIKAIVSSVHINFRNFKLTKNGATNAFSIYIQPSDFDNLLSADFASFISENGHLIPWLEWLLTAGDAIVVTEFSVKYGPSDYSRTGIAIMVPFGFFKVDSKYSGTVTNNFITRAVEKNIDEIYNAIKDNL